jgi:hypothetical protein
VKAEGAADDQPDLRVDLLNAAANIVFFAMNRYRCFAVTSRRILVLDTGRWSLKRAHGVVAELPRSTRLGPASGVWHVIEVNGQKLRVHRRFFKDILVADQAHATHPEVV